MPTTIRGNPNAAVVMIGEKAADLLRLQVDGSPLDPSILLLVNDSVGETGTPLRASELGAENGFYLRRGQEARIALGGVVLAPGPHRVRAELGLGGVTSLAMDEDVEFGL